MFRRRLSIALGLLTAAAMLEGLGAAAAHKVAKRQVDRGRVAGDIRTAFVDLSATKQRLRTWVAQRQQRAGAEAGARERLPRDMRRTLERLEAQVDARTAELRDALSLVKRPLNLAEGVRDAALQVPPARPASLKCLICALATPPMNCLGSPIGASAVRPRGAGCSFAGAAWPTCGAPAKTRRPTPPTCTSAGRAPASMRTGSRR
jgi:hypothetical protein